MSDSIIIPIVIDPKAGVAGLRAIGDQAEKTNQKFDAGASSAGKFASSMKSLAGNAFLALESFNLIHHGVKFLVEGLMDAILHSDKLASSTSMLNKIQNEAVMSTRKEVVELQTLFSVAKDTSRTYSEREAAIAKMNKEYPELHNNLRLETIGTQDVANAIQGVINKLVNEVRLKNTIAQIADMTNAMEEFYAYAKEKEGTIFSGVALSKADKLKSQIADLTKAAEDLQSTTLLNGKDDKMLGSMFKQDIKPPHIKISPEKLSIEPAFAEVKYKGPVGGADEFFTKMFQEMFPSSLGALGAKVIEEMKKAENERKYDLSKPTGQGAKNQAAIIEDVNAKYLRQADIITSILTPATDSLFDAIMKREGAIKAFFSSMASAIQNVIKQLMRAVVQAGILSLLTGGASNVKGGGLSFGGALKKILGFASGGLTFGPTAAIVGEGMGTNRSNPEVIAPLDRLRSFFSDMLAINNGFNTRNMGVSGSIVGMPSLVELRLRGRDAVGMIKLENLSQGRTG